MIKIAFIGLGSIAKRHICNLSEILIERGETFQIDLYRHNSTSLEDNEIKRLISKIYLYNELGKSNYDIIFITNPTALHYETLQRCVNLTKHIFIEKPVFSSSSINVYDINLKTDGVYYVACPLRYTEVIQYLKERINPKMIFSVRAISSSYLPDWRPGQDYRESYSANRKLGGGVSIDLIHEWDYLAYLFGFPDRVLYAGGKYSNLEIDSDDLAVYIGIYSDKLIELHLDYFGRKTERRLMLYTEDDVINADMINNCISYEKDGSVLRFNDDRNKYQKRELEHFLDIIDGKCENDNNIYNAIQVLKLTGN